MRRYRIVSLVYLIAFGILAGSCKKDETTAPVQNGPALAVGQASFSLHPGDSSSTTISGGTPPYILVNRGDTTKVLPTLSGSLLTIYARAAGTSTIIAGDNSSPALNARINVAVTVLPLAANPPAVTLQDTIPQNVTISTGIHPYVIAQAPDPALATAQFVNPNLNTAVLMITGVSTATGSTSVIVRDASTPQRSVVVNIVKTR